MADQYVRFPSTTSSSTNPSVGPSGSTAPTSDTLVGFVDDSTGFLAPFSGATAASGPNVVVSGSALPTGGATSANQVTQENTLTAIEANQTNGTQTVVINSSALPTGAATNAELETINSTLGSPFQAGGAISNTAFIADVLDATPATQNITAQDTGSTTTAVANGQNFITGTPTAGSTALFTTLNNKAAVEVMATGTWTGTLSIEVSMDGGTTFMTRGLKQTGSSYFASTFTANFEGGENFAGMTHFRVRATAAWTGTATIRVVASQNNASLIVSNPLTLRDFSVQSVQNTIKAASTAPVATDTALVVAISPNSPLATGSATAALQSSVQGAAAAGTAATNSELVGMVYNSTPPAPTNGQQLALQSDQYGNLITSQMDITVTGAATQTSTVNNILTISSGMAATNVDGFRSVSVQVNSTGTGGTYIFEGSNDNVNFVAMPVWLLETIGNNVGTIAAITATAANIIYVAPITTNYMRLRIATTITGGSIQAFSRFSAEAWQNPVASVTLANSSGNLVGQVVTPIPASIADITNAAITTSLTSAAITPAYASSYMINMPFTAVSGTNPTFTMVVQESADAGTNWYTTYTFPVITATGSYNSPVLPVTGNRIRYVQTITGTTPSFTRQVNRLVSIQSEFTVPATTTYTDRSGTTSGTPSTSTQVCAYNQTRRYFIIQNLSTTTAIYINFTTAANTTSSLYIGPLGSYVMESATITTEAVNVLSTGTSIAFAAKEG
jgi:hypothetical protein